MTSHTGLVSIEVSSIVSQDFTCTLIPLYLIPNGLVAFWVNCLMLGVKGPTLLTGDVCSIWQPIEPFFSSGMSSILYWAKMWWCTYHRALGIVDRRSFFAIVVILRSSWRLDIGQCSSQLDSETVSSFFTCIVHFLRKTCTSLSRPDAFPCKSVIKAGMATKKCGSVLQNVGGKGPKVTVDWLNRTSMRGEKVVCCVGSVEIRIKNVKR